MEIRSNLLSTEMATFLVLFAIVKAVLSMETRSVGVKYHKDEQVVSNRDSAHAELLDEPAITSNPTSFQCKILHLKYKVPHL